MGYEGQGGREEGGKEGEWGRGRGEGEGGRRESGIERAGRGRSVEGWVGGNGWVEGWSREGEEWVN